MLLIPSKFHESGFWVKEPLKMRKSNSKIDVSSQISEKFSQAYKIQMFVPMVRGKRAVKFLHEVIDNYEAVIKIKPDYHRALNNLGIALLNLAKLKTGSEAQQLLDESIVKYKAALEIKPDDNVSLNNWGISLLHLAEMKSGEEAETLYNESIQKYEAALDIEPDYHVALISWGSTLLDLSDLKTGKEEDDCLRLAESKLIRAEEISPGCGSYNLACLAALRGESLECKKWLESARKYDTLQSIRHMGKDQDFDSVRSEKWFKDFLKKQKYQYVKGRLKKLFWF